MKKIGIVGGVGWPSTIDYYRLICQGANAHFRALGHAAPLPTPPIAIESVNQARTRSLRGGADGSGWEGFDAVFRDAFRRLEAAGCDFGLLASNTPHARLQAIREGLDLPVLDMIAENARAAAATGAARALVLGTSVTMQGELYPRALSALGVRPIPRLPEAEIAAMQALIDEEFYSGATPAGTERLIEACRRHAPDPADTVILLACTELPLAFPDHADDAVFEARGFRFLNTSVVHARAALAEALGEGAGSQPACRQARQSCRRTSTSACRPVAESDPNGRERTFLTLSRRCISSARGECRFMGQTETASHSSDSTAWRM